MIPLPKAKSIKKIKAPNTRIEMNVSTVLSCNSFQVGQVTLFINSSYDSFKYVIIAAITLIFARAPGLEPRSTVLETAILPLNYARKVVSINVKSEDRNLRSFRLHYVVLNIT